MDPLLNLETIATATIAVTGTSLSAYVASGQWLMLFGALLGILHRVGVKLLPFIRLSGRVSAFHTYLIVGALQLVGIVGAGILNANDPVRILMLCVETLGAYSVALVGTNAVINKNSGKNTANNEEKRSE